MVSYEGGLADETDSVSAPGSTETGAAASEEMASTPLLMGPASTTSAVASEDDGIEYIVISSDSDSGAKSDSSETGSESEFDDSDSDSSSDFTQSDTETDDSVSEADSDETVSTTSSESGLSPTAALATIEAKGMGYSESSTAPAENFDRIQVGSGGIRWHALLAKS